MFRDIPIEEQRALQSAHVEEIEAMSNSDRLRMVADSGMDLMRRFGGNAHFDHWADLLVRSGVVDPSVFASADIFREQVMGLHLASRWAEFGFNLFDLSQDLAAAFILTEPPPTPEGGLHLPFPTFCIRIPDGVVPLFSFGKQLWADTLWAHQFSGLHRSEGETKFLRVIAGKKSLMVWRDRYPSNIDDPKDEDFFSNTLIGDPPLQEEDALTTSAALRVLKNLIAWLDSMGGLSSQPKPEPPHLKRKASQESRERVASGVWPHVWFFGKEVKLGYELRRLASEVVLGGSKDHAVSGWKVRVRHVVRGHWKPSQSRWIQPYWRGPEGAAAWSHIYK